MYVCMHIVSVGMYECTYDDMYVRTYIHLLEMYKHTFFKIANVQ